MLACPICGSDKCRCHGFAVGDIVMAELENGSIVRGKVVGLYVNRALDGREFVRFLVRYALPSGEVADRYFPYSKLWGV